jgi:hypothetical protein
LYFLYKSIHIKKKLLEREMILCKHDISKFGFGFFCFFFFFFFFWLVVQLLVKNVSDWKEREVLSGSLELGTTTVVQ